VVWARRFAAYKRPDLIARNLEKFNALVSNKQFPIQIIWAGKPYPMDYGAISTFNSLVHLSKQHKNVAVCVGYELTLSKRLKQASDIWLNTPRVPREASGTSGMTAAMNGSVNFSTYDGWICEFARHGENSFIVPQANYQELSIEDQDEQDLEHLYNILCEEILPLYYSNKRKWRDMVQAGMQEVRTQFDSNRMAREYYELLYHSS
jgi:starch phosphorylase